DSFHKLKCKSERPLSFEMGASRPPQDEVYLRSIVAILMVRSVAKRRVSNHGIASALCSIYSPSRGRRSLRRFLEDQHRVALGAAVDDLAVLDDPGEISAALQHRDV